MDATFDLLSKVKRGKTDNPQIFLMAEPVYNIDDMDGKIYMMDRSMSGCIGFMSTKQLDPAYPGQVTINGEAAGSAVLGGAGFMGLQLVGIFVRRHLVKYGTTYHIHYEGARDTDGMEILPFDCDITTLPKQEPGTVYPEHDPIVLQAAREGAVLLKNENHVLPLAAGTTINAFGKGGPTFRLGCVGAGKINPRYGIRFQEGIERYSSLNLNQELFDFYRSEQDVLPAADMLSRAKEASEIGVIVLTRGTGEAIDNRPEKGNYYLTDDEKALIAGVSKEFAKTVAILNTGYPIEMNWVEEYHIDAVLWTGLCGMAGGRALAELLDGSVSPSGKLPDTWAYDYYDIPAAKNFPIPDDAGMSGSMMPGMKTKPYSVLVYEEDMYVGYRYFETFRKPVAYAFGHGLSYTTFTKECLSVSDRSGNLTVKVRVTNTGKVFGKETVLIFAEIPDGKLEQPSRRLVAFGKTDDLAPGASEILQLEILQKRFESYDEERAAWIIEQGTIKLYLGGSVQEAIKCGQVEIESEIITNQVKNRIQPPFSIRTLSKKNPTETYPTGEKTCFTEAEDLPYRRVREKQPEQRKVLPSSKKTPDTLITFPMVVADESLLDDFVLQLSDYELARMSVGARTGWGMGDNGFAGTLYNVGKLEKYQIPDYFFSDGNNGLNMNDANIGFPVSNVMCATFNEQLSYEEGRAIAKEARGMELQCILAPAMNLHRNPLCGRYSEYFSEDPYLAGRMGGMESKGLESGGVASCMKHFFANNAETLRSTSHSIMTERAARELYLRVFETAFEVHVPDSMMTGYNPTNGCWCAGDEELLEGILREEWGYDGYVMTDWGSSGCCDSVETAQGGNSWVAPGEMDDSEVAPMVEAMANGTLDRERVRRNVRDMYAKIRKYL